MGDLLGLSLGPRCGLRRAVGASTWLARGVALEADQPEAAMAAYRRALAGCPSFADAHNNLGRLLHQRGELAEAELHYRAALAAEASSLHWFNLGVALDDQQRRDAAIEAYREALALEPAMREAHLNLARLLDQRGRGTGQPADLQAAVRHLAQYRRLRA
ncbi:MAG: tetratricopeptide repeat protein [Kofleriaceae bacterium]